MTVSETLRSRVSTRAYTDKRPSVETVMEILDAARWSASNLPVKCTGRFRGIDQLRRKAAEQRPAQRRMRSLSMLRAIRNPRHLGHKKGKSERSYFWVQTRRRLS
jgi:nitroreductase